jgi:hypothetical protein
MYKKRLRKWNIFKNHPNPDKERKPRKKKDKSQLEESYSPASMASPSSSVGVLSRTNSVSGPSGQSLSPPYGYNQSMPGTSMFVTSESYPEILLRLILNTYVFGARSSSQMNDTGDHLPASTALPLQAANPLTTAGGQLEVDTSVYPDIPEWTHGAPVSFSPFSHDEEWPMESTGS